jgi:hemerythrin
MPLLNWYNRYSVNNAELDNHHKSLFGIFNRLYDICMTNDEVDSFESAVDELVSYSEYHFKAEEQYMRDIKYKDIERQISEHKYFTERVIELKQKSNTADHKLCHDIIVFLGNWLMHHVIEEDKKISL